MCMLNVDRMNPYPSTIHFVACRRCCAATGSSNTARIPTKRKTGLGRSGTQLARHKVSPAALQLAAGLLTSANRSLALPRGQMPWPGRTETKLPRIAGI
jgi:hypothetical protein